MPAPAPGPAPGPAAARQVTRAYRRRRRPLPAVILIVALGVVATVVWIRTLESAEKRAGNSCSAPQPVAATQPSAAAAPGSGTDGAPGGANPAAPPAQRGDALAAGALDDVEPLPPDAVKVRVLNGNGQRGQAALVDGVLISDLGFGRAGEPANDPVYQAFDLDCHAQIRFGEAGTAAGRTLSLVVPCAELVRDSRADDTVDLALGQRFDTLQPSPEAKEALRQLTELAAQPTNPAGSQGGQQGAPASVDPSLLALARAQSRC